MSSRDTMEACLAEGRPALMAYLPVGYPTVEGSLAAMRAVVEAGADIVEVGVPYSDPVMDGTVIQDAASTALRRGVRVDHVFDAVAAVRAAGATPVVMSYSRGPSHPPRFDGTRTPRHLAGRGADLLVRRRR